MGAGARPSRSPRYPQGQNALCHYPESRPWRGVRCVTHPGSLWVGRKSGRRPSIRVVGARPGLLSSRAVDDRSRRYQPPNQHLGAQPVAERGLHARPAHCLGYALRIAIGQMDARSRHFLLRSESELVLQSRRVLPGILQEQGFDFKFPSWPGAAQDLCRRWCQTYRYRNNRAVDRRLESPISTSRLSDRPPDTRTRFCVQPTAPRRRPPAR